jgi:hypothetical protein
MTSRTGSLIPSALPEKLTAAVPVTVQLSTPVTEAAGRLRLAIDSSEAVEVATDTHDRRLTGEISAGSVRLSVSDSDRSHRRVGWRIEFVGRFESAPAPGVLDGFVDIGNHWVIRARIWFLRLAALIPLALGIGSASGILNSVSAPIFDALFGAGIGLVGLVGASWVQDSIERAAADDAQVLMAFLRSRLS